MAAPADAIFAVKRRIASGCCRVRRCSRRSRAARRADKPQSRASSCRLPVRRTRAQKGDARPERRRGAPGPGDGHYHLRTSARQPRSFARHHGGLRERVKGGPPLSDTDRRRQQPAQRGLRGDQAGVSERSRGVPDLPPALVDEVKRGWQVTCRGAARAGYDAIVGRKIAQLGEAGVQPVFGSDEVSAGKRRGTRRGWTPPGCASSAWSR